MEGDRGGVNGLCFSSQGEIFMVDAKSTITLSHKIKNYWSCERLLNYYSAVIIFGIKKTPYLKIFKPSHQQLVMMVLMARVAISTHRT